jgi:proteasome assembly chaperone (PAC2) family protein
MERRPSSIRLRITPELQHPYLLAAWSGMGAVALLTANYLRQELDAKPFAEFDAHDFFSPSHVPIVDGLIQEPELPQARFYYWDEGRAHDLIILVGTEQPSNAYEMALQVIDLAQQFGVERIFTSAAFPTLIHHTHEPGVWGTATHPDLVALMEAHKVTIMDQGTIGGLNGLLLTTALERGMGGLCLLGEIPIYATQIVNPRASRAVLTILAAMIAVEIDLERLSLWADHLRPEMDALYKVLPSNLREAVESNRGTPHAPLTASSRAEQPLVADANFFEAIEQFLQQSRRSGGDPAQGDDSGTEDAQ